MRSIFRKMNSLYKSMSNIRVSDNFYSHEFAVSEDYPDLAKKIIITAEYIKILMLLCESNLQPIRDRFGVVNIISGIRSKELNSAIKGSRHSDHLLAQAADISLPNTNMLTVFKWLYGYKFHYRQLIWYPEQNFIHISINIPGRPFKNETFVKEKGDYTPWV